MSVQTDQRPAPAQQSAARPTPAAAKQPAKADHDRNTHGWWLALLVLVAAAVAFGLMFLITQLAGGDGYRLN